MFQIVCALALDVPEVLHKLDQLRDVPTNVQLSCEPWDHIHHADMDYGCLSSDHTVAYIHELLVASSSPDLDLALLLPPEERREVLSNYHNVILYYCVLLV